MDAPTELTHRVLVADDDDDLRDLIAVMLREDGNDVIEARDGAELIHQLEAAMSSDVGVPDLIITDVCMPLLSGLGVLQTLRRAHVAMPVIVITALADESVRCFAARLGAVSVLTKPFDMIALRIAVAKARGVPSSAPPRL